MSKLYACAGSGNCFKPWLAMTQLGQSFELQMIDVLSGEQKSESYLAINPLGVVPFLMLEGEGSLGESNAMLWHIAEGTRLMPSSRFERAEALQWMFFEQSKLEPFISPARFATTIVPALKEERAEEIAIWQHKAEIGLSRLNQHLTGRKFMLESGYSFVDIAIFGYVHVADEAGLRLDDFSEIARWVTDVTCTQAFRPLSEMTSSLLAAA